MDDPYREPQSDPHVSARATLILWIGHLLHAAECNHTLCTDLSGLEHNQDLALGFGCDCDCVGGLHAGGSLDELPPGEKDDRSFNTWDMFGPNEVVYCSSCHCISVGYRYLVNAHANGMAAKFENEEEDPRHSYASSGLRVSHEKALRFIFSP